MADIRKIEYRVVPVTRYIVTRFHSENDGGDRLQAGCEGKGEFDNEKTAYEVGYALAKEEHDRLGYPPGDERIIYPQPIETAREIGGQALKEKRVPLPSYREMRGIFRE